jgi:hypothetical protein
VERPTTQLSLITSAIFKLVYFPMTQLSHPERRTKTNVIEPSSNGASTTVAINSPALSLDRVNIARSDERMITLDFNGITKTTNTESAILREDHLVFVALPSELHAYVMRKKRRLPPASPLLLPSTKFSPSHLYKHDSYATC